MKRRHLLLVILLQILIQLAKCKIEKVTETTEYPTTLSYSAIYYESGSGGEQNSEKNGTGGVTPYPFHKQVGEYDIEIEDSTDVPTTEFPDFVSDDLGDENISTIKPFVKDEGEGTNSSANTQSSSTETIVVPPKHRAKAKGGSGSGSGSGRSLSLITIRSKPRVRLSELVRPALNSSEHFYLGKLDILKSKWVVNDFHKHLEGSSASAESQSQSQSHGQEHDQGQGSGSESGSGSGSGAGDVFTVGEDLKNTSLVFLECFAHYPVHWTHDSLKVTPYSTKWDQVDVEDSNGHTFTNETSILEIANHLGVNGATFNGGKNYTVTLLIGRGAPSRILQEKDSGNYSCVADSDDGTTVATSVYIYIPEEQQTSPCIQSPCGLNAVCEVRHGNQSCSCLPGFYGNAHVKCREECTLNSDCSETEACVYNKCVDICIGACGKNSYCQIENQIAMCHCIKGFEGDAYFECHKTPMPNQKQNLTDTAQTNNNNNNNSTSNSTISTTRSLASSETLNQSQNQNASKIDEKVQLLLNESNSESDFPSANQTQLNDFCSHCGINADCVSTENQTLVCKCRRNYFGDPYSKCQLKTENDGVLNQNGNETAIISTPCTPSPCGENTRCEEKYERAICHCEENHYGDPWTKCHPECLRRQDCPETQICVQMKCQDACIGACGEGAVCQVTKHIASCSCPENMIGDPYVLCKAIVIETVATNSTNDTDVAADDKDTNTELNSVTTTEPSVL